MVMRNGSMYHLFDIYRYPRKRSIIEGGGNMDIEISYHYNTALDAVVVLYETDEWSLSAQAGTLPEGF